MRVRIKKINVPDREGHYIIREYDDFEFVNPIEQIASMYISSMMSFEREFLAMTGFEAPDEIIEEMLFKRVVTEWNDQYGQYKSIKVPDNLKHLLDAKSKKEQIKSLKGLSLTTDELVAFIFYAYEKYGYKLSQYKTSHHHAGIDTTKLPELIHIEDDGTITTVGKTEMTKGQLKQVVQHRSVKVSKFLDKDGLWHCFFLTFRSLKGEETYKDGQPHLHYISDKWGISRKKVRKQLTSKKYNLPSVPHVDFHTHRNPRNIEI